MSRAEQIAANLAAVRERMGKALATSRRTAASIRLLAVCKTVTAEDVLAAIAAGQLDLAENYGQEFRDKHIAVEQALLGLSGRCAPDWHFIGPLQSNKVKYVVGKAALIHSVSSAEILSAIERKAAAMGVIQQCLVQVNVAGEAQKSGISPSELPAALDSFALHPHLRCSGLMVIPPYADDPELSRPHFSALRRLRDEHANQPRANVVLQELSMGMSHDLEVAICEGATMVRVGTAIFGERP